jgi:hypothetical protein
MQNTVRDSFKMARGGDWLFLSIDGGEGELQGPDNIGNRSNGGGEARKRLGRWSFGTGGSSMVQQWWGKEASVSKLKSFETGSLALLFIAIFGWTHRRHGVESNPISNSKIHMVLVRIRLKGESPGLQRAWDQVGSNSHSMGRYPSVARYAHKAEVGAGLGRGGHGMASNGVVVGQCVTGWVAR